MSISDNFYVLIGSGWWKQVVGTMPNLELSSDLGCRIFDAAPMFLPLSSVNVVLLLGF